MRHQNWIAVLLDLAIVILGVFLGLQAQSWSESRRDRRIEADYVARLTQDFTAIERRLDRCLTVYGDGVAAIDRIKKALGAEAGEVDFVAMSDAIIALTAEFPPAGRSYAFVEMTAAGQFAVLRDTALRGALVAYDEQAQINRAQWRSLLAEVVRRQEALYRHVDVDIDLEREPFASIAGVDDAGLRADDEFRVMLNFLAGAKANNFELCRVQRRLSDAVSEALAGANS